MGQRVERSGANVVHDGELTHLATEPRLAALVPDEQLLNRIRAILAGRADVVEERMVGGRSFIVGGRMACGVTGKALMVRVSAGDRGAVLKESHVRPMTLGGRELAAYVLVDPAGCATEAQLRTWIQRGIAAT